MSHDEQVISNGSRKAITRVAREAAEMHEDEEWDESRGYAALTPRSPFGGPDAEVEVAFGGSSGYPDWVEAVIIVDDAHSDAFVDAIKQEVREALEDAGVGTVSTERRGTSNHYAYRIEF